MILHTIMFSFSEPRKVKLLAVMVMGFIGLAIAVATVLFSQEQAVVLSQISQELSQSPIGVIVTSIKGYF